MSANSRITLVLRPREGETLDGLQFYAQLGAPVSVGRALGVISSIYEGDAVNGLLDLEEGHSPDLRQLIDHVPGLYLQVSNEVKQEALNDGDDEAEADYKAGQALRVLLMFKQRIEKQLEPDLLSVDKSGVNQISASNENVNRTTEKSSAVPTENCPDPRDSFIKINPIGASAVELEKGRNGFVDERTQGDYLIFLAGFKAAQEKQA